MMQYSFVKNTTFNGTPLPDLAVLDEDGSYRVLRTFGYEDFPAACWEVIFKQVDGFTLLRGAFGLLGGDTELAFKRRDLLAQLLLLLAAADHLHLDLADLHRQGAPRVGIAGAARLVLPVEDLLLIRLVGLA